MMKIVFFGDIVGKSGRRAVGDYLKNVSADFIIANVENASHGFGLTEKNYNEISEYGVHCMTSGNHIWDKKEIFNYIESAEKLVRPINYPQGTKGQGSRVFEVGEYKIAVINALGRVFMNPVDSPWDILKCEIERLKEITPIIIVDFHAEATAEKICLGRFCSDFGVSAFFGTHTHVQTSDEKIINNMAYITDAGFCGAKESVIGMEYETSLKRLSTSLPERYEVAEDYPWQINGLQVDIDPVTGYATDIKRFFCEIDNNEEKKDES